jgi:hypothetical protein
VEPYAQQLARGRRFFETEKELLDERRKFVEGTAEIFDNTYSVFVLVIPISERRCGPALLR